MGLQTPFRDKTIRELAVGVMEISRAGLNARAKLNAHGENETVFLQELDEFVKSGKSNADLLIEKFNGEWGGDILRAYEDCRY
jgi:glutamate--cysteine ligase